MHLSRRHLKILYSHCQQLSGWHLSLSPDFVDSCLREFLNPGLLREEEENVDPFSFLNLPTNENEEHELDQFLLELPYRPETGPNQHIPVPMSGPPHNKSPTAVASNYSPRKRARTGPEEFYKKDNIEELYKDSIDNKDPLNPMSPDSGYETPASRSRQGSTCSTVCASPGSLFSDSVLSDSTNYIKLGKRDRSSSVEETVQSTGSTNCSDNLNNVMCKLTANDFQQDLLQFRAGSHCSQEVTIQIQDKLGIKKNLGPRKLTLITLKFLQLHFKSGSVVMLKKKASREDIVAAFASSNMEKKRSVVACGDVLRGVVLHMKDTELFANDTSLTKTERKAANNKFSHYQRPDRTAGDKLVKEFSKQCNLEEDYTYEDLEAKAGVSLMIFSKTGYLEYSSSELKDTNCVFLNGEEANMCLVKERFLKAFGNVYNVKKPAAKKAVVSELEQLF